MHEHISTNWVILLLNLAAKFKDKASKKDKSRRETAGSNEFGPGAIECSGGNANHATNSEGRSPPKSLVPRYPVHDTCTSKALLRVLDSIRFKLVVNKNHEKKLNLIIFKNFLKMRFYKSNMSVREPYLNPSKEQDIYNFLIFLCT